MDQVKRSFENVVKQQGSTVVIYKNYGAPNEQSFEMKGVKSTRKERPQDHIFMFPDDPGVQEGDVLKLKVSSELWKTVRKTETIAGDVVVYHVIDVVNLKSPSLPQGGSQHVTIHSHGPNYGGIQINSPHATQHYIVRAEIPATIQELKELITKSDLPSLDKEDAVQALGRVEELSDKTKTPDVVQRITDKMAQVKKLVTDGTAIATVAVPLCEKLIRLLAL